MPSAPSIPPPAAKRSRLWLAVALLFALVRVFPIIAAPMGEDQAMYVWIAQGLLRGLKLYRDLWDIKPPGIFWLYLPIVKLFGPAMWSVGLVDILWLLAISYCIFRFTERYVGPVASAIAVGVNAVWHCRAGYVHAGQTETFLTLFVFVAYFQVWRGDRWAVYRHFAAGLLLGAAFWLKYNALAFLPFLLLVPDLDLSSFDTEPLRIKLAIPWRLWMKRATALLAGLAAVILAVLAYFWQAGLLRILWNDQFKVVRQYGRSALPESLMEYLVQPVAAAIIGLGAWTVVASIVALVLARKTRDLSRFGPLFLGELFGYASAAAQLRVSSFEFETCYPFAAMVWGYLAVRTYEIVSAGDYQLFPARRRRLARILVWIVPAAAVLLPARTELKSLAVGYRWLGGWLRNPGESYGDYPSPFIGEHLRDEFKVIDYLKEHAVPDDKLYIWGTDSRIYVSTGITSPTRFVPNFPLMSHWVPDEWRDELVRDLRRSPPTFLVVGRKDALWGLNQTHLDSEQYLKVFPGLDSFISEQYQPVEAFPSFVIYRRKVAP